MEYKENLVYGEPVEKYGPVVHFTKIMDFS